MNFARLKLMRSAARVKRCHIMHTAHQQTVGEHTFGVLCLVHDIITPRNPSPQLVKAALYHDVTETIRGDPPAPVMREPELARGYRRLDDEIEVAFELRVSDLEPWEEQVLRYCDSMEFALYAFEEVDCGNVIFMPRARYVLKSIRDRERHKCTPAAEALQLIMEQRALEYPQDLGRETLHGYHG